MPYTKRPFNYTGTLPNQVQNDLELADDNFDILGQAFVNNDPTTGIVRNADMVDGFHASQTPTANTIPVAGSTGKLDAGWLPTVGNFNMVDFASSGTWIVPSEVTKIIVIACAGGGGGGGGNGGTAGGNGGDTVIFGSVSGNLLTLVGGGGGSVGGARVSPGGSSPKCPGEPGIDAYSSHPGGTGGSSIFGGGGRVTGEGTAARGEDAKGYGSGGGGGSSSVSSGGGGGGAGDYVCGAVFAVTPGETLNITIGAGGNGGNSGGSGASGGKGAPGFVRIIYLA